MESLAYSVAFLPCLDEVLALRSNVHPHSSLTPLPTTTMEGLPAGLNYLQYPHTEAFGMPSLARECPSQGCFLSMPSCILPLQPPEVSAPCSFTYFPFPDRSVSLRAPARQRLLRGRFFLSRNVSPLQSPEVSAPCSFTLLTDPPNCSGCWNITNPTTGVSLSLQVPLCGPQLC